MTPEQLRELDARVAERVMGWKIERNVFDTRTCDELTPRYDLGIVEADGSCRRRTPHYSSDIAAAFQVAERMRKLGWCWQLMHFDRPAAIFEKGWPEPHSITVEMDAATIQEAICHAALAAMEREAK